MKFIQANASFKRQHVDVCTSRILVIRVPIHWKIHIINAYVSDRRHFYCPENGSHAYRIQISVKTDFCLQHCLSVYFVSFIHIKVHPTCYKWLIQENESHQLKRLCKLKKATVYMYLHPSFASASVSFMNLDMYKLASLK